MKIKLIYPPKIRGEEQKPEVVLPPLGISILTSYLRKHNIKTEQEDLDIKLDYHRLRNKWIPADPFVNKEIVYDYVFKDKLNDSLLSAAENILKLTRYKNFDLIGFSIMDNFEFLDISPSLVLAKLIKEKTGAKIVFGGSIHPFHEFQELSFVDYVIKGDGREPLLQLCKLIDSKTENHYKQLNGDNKKEKLILNYPGPYKKNCVTISESFFTIPDFDGLPLDLYTSNLCETTYRKKKNLILPYVFGFGCVNGCIFCPESDMRHARFNKPSTVVEELAYLTKKYKTNTFYFVNTLVNPTYDYADRLCENIFENKLDIKWTDCVCFKNLDTKLLNKLRMSGAIRLVFGLETGSEKLLKYIKKGVSIKHAERILKHSHELGIWNCVELITGLPYEKDSDIKRTLAFIKKNRLYVNEFKLNKFHVLSSELLSNPKKYRLKILSPLREEKFNTNINQIRFEERRKSWNKELNRMERSYRVICDCVRDCYLFPPPMEILFRINMSGKNYEFIKNFYKSVWGRCNIKESLNEKTLKAELIKELILRVPDNEGLWIKLANIYETLKDSDSENEELKTQLKTLAKMNLKSRFGYDLLGRILLRSGLYDDTSSFLKNNPKHFSHDPFVLRTLGEHYLGLEDYKKAVYFLEKAVKSGLKTETTLFDLGRACYHARAYKKSVNYLESALEKCHEKVQKPHIANYLLISCYKTNQIKKIMEIKKRYLKEIPEMMVEYYLGLKKYDRVKKELKEVIKKTVKDKNHDPIELLLRTARYYWETKGYKKALRHYHKLLRIKPSDPKALRGIGECYMELKDYNKAAIYLKKAIKQKPYLSWSWFDLGKVYHRTSEYNKSILCLKEELKNSLENLSKFHSLYYLAMNYKELGDYEKVRRYIQEAQNFKNYYNKEETDEEKGFKELLKKVDKIG
jgi:radical SAM superfamily enzyme YgiQ (UPF0313 family)/predicted Zn-dependent protease